MYFKGGNISVWNGNNYENVLNDINRFNLNIITLPVIIDIPSLTSSEAVIREESLTFAKKVASLLPTDVKIILEPYPFINNGHDSETAFNPTDKDAFFASWEDVIKKLHTDISKEKEIFAVYVASNFVMLENETARWGSLISNIRKITSAKITYRINAWITASWSESHIIAYQEKLNNPIFGLLDFISVASYFELTETANPTKQELISCLHSTTIYGRGQNVFQEVKNFYDKWKKPIFLGELGVPNREGGATTPWANLTDNPISETIQNNYFGAYLDVFDKGYTRDIEKWFWGFSIYCISDNFGSTYTIPKGSDAESLIKNYAVEDYNESTQDSYVATTDAIFESFEIVTPTSIKGGEKTRVAIKVKTKKDLKTKYYLNPSITHTSDEKFKIINAQFEKGNVLTDYKVNVEERFESLSTAIRVQQGQINTAIDNTTIIKDGETITLKDAHSNLEQTVSGFNSTISETTTKVNELGTIVSNAETKIEQLADSINLKVDVDGIKSAIALDQSGVKIGGEHIDLEGQVTISSLDSKLSEVFGEEYGTTVIDGGKIKTGSVTADKVNVHNLTVKDNDENITLHISEEGNVQMRGDISSYDYNERENTGWSLNKEGNAVLNNATVRGNVILPHAGITNQGDSVRFWAGTEYENREDAPFKVLQDGSIHATKGHFGGTFTGRLEIGDIVLEDTDKGYLQMNDNDGNKVIHVGEEEVYFKPNTMFGDDNSNLKINTTNVVLNNKAFSIVKTVEDVQTTVVKVNPNEEKFLEINETHSLKTSDTTLEIIGNHTQFSNDVTVVGDLSADNMVVGEMRMERKNDVGNRGLDFIFI